MVLHNRYWTRYNTLRSNQDYRGDIAINRCLFIVVILKCWEIFGKHRQLKECSISFYCEKNINCVTKALWQHSIAKELFIFCDFLLRISESNAEALLSFTFLYLLTGKLLRPPSIRKQSFLMWDNLHMAIDVMCCCSSITLQVSLAIRGC